MKIKLLLPVERLGLIILHGEPEISFYQLTRSLLEQHNVDIHKCILRDSYNKQYNMAKPMGAVGFYAGISLELYYRPDISAFEMDEVKNPLAVDKVLITFIRLFNNCDSITLEVNRHSSVLSVLLNNRLVTDQELVCVFQGEVFPITLSFDQIGVISDSELELIHQQSVAVNPDTLQQTQLELLNEQQLEQQEQLTSEEYAQMKRDKQRWQMEMGHGQFLTENEKNALKQTRIQRKGVLQFKIICSQLRKNLNLKITVKSDAKIEDIFKELNVLFIKQFGQSQNEEQLSNLLQSYKLRNGRGGQIIFASEFEAYDYFNGADAVLDFEVEPEFAEWF
ncbi:Conserved_hypothetical protein [Hexamita inflata]|uniref:Uncharacterized protein n=1 Tax=Hexamita inflata TaxID=28002 RepID=A0AA86R373_9EUKA|nr:Conserved hypothetical protein [Hexamita inflata]